MKALVTGATGFLGRHLVRQLVEAGHEVRGLVRRDVPELEREGAELVHGDVLDPASLEEAAAGADVLFHLAGGVRHRGDATHTFELNVEGTRNALRAASRAGVGRFVHMSSSGTVAVSTDGAVATEASPYATETVRRWPYYLSKVYAEKLALEAHQRGDVPVVVLSPSLLLGPGDTALSSSQALVRFLNREIPAVPPGGVNFVDVRDVAYTTVVAAGRGQSGERYLLGGPNMTVEAFFVLLEKVSNVPAPVVKAPAAVNDLTARVLETLEDLGGSESDESVAYAMAGHTWYLDASKAQRELGFRHRPPEATLRDAVTWLRARGRLPRPKGLLGSAVRQLRRVLDPK